MIEKTTEEFLLVHVHFSVPSQLEPVQWVLGEILRMMLLLETSG